MLISVPALTAQTDKFVPVEQEIYIEQKIRESTGSIKTIHCNFTQEKKMEYLDSDLKSTGEFWYKYPDRVRWEYVSPYEYTIILNQKKISLISNNSTNEIEMENNETFEKMNALIVNAVSGKVFDNENYTTKILENKKFYKVDLVPGSPQISHLINQMELYFDKGTFSINKLKIIEPNSDYSFIHFSNQKLNEPIPENIFIP
jgi:outer membrane lipoprotein carrier protein